MRDLSVIFSGSQCPRDAHLARFYGVSNNDGSEANSDCHIDSADIHKILLSWAALRAADVPLLGCGRAVGDR